MFTRRKKPRKTKKPLVDLEDTWKKVAAAIDDLVDFISGLSKQLEENGKVEKPFNYKQYTVYYSAIFDICTKKVNSGKLDKPPTEILYERYGTKISEYLNKIIVPALKGLQDGDELLNEAVKRWRDHQIIIKWMNKLFAYLNRFFTKHNNRDSLRDVGLKRYQQLVYGSIKHQMARALLDKIHAERVGDMVDRSVMRDGIKLFIEMGLGTLTAYETGFESPLTHDTSDFYTKVSAKWITEDSCSDYLKKAQKTLAQELIRCDAYLHESSVGNVIKCVETAILKNHQKALLNMEHSGFIHMLNYHKLEDLQRMFKLFKRINNGLVPMAEMLEGYLKEMGFRMIKKHSEKKDIDIKVFVEETIEMHEKYTDLVANQFNKNFKFVTALKNAFTSFIDKEIQNEKQRYSTSEMLSTYMDTKLRNSKISDEDYDELMDKVVRVFGYLGEKDVFVEYYRRQLSRRLLVYPHPNIDAEKNFITKLKICQGATFTSKLEGMISDKTLSEELQTAFQSFTKKKALRLTLEFQPQVLTTGFWPQFNICNLNVPSEMRNCVNVFKDFYDSRTQSRLLKWVHSLGSSTLIGRFRAGEKEVSASTYQGCTLLLFNQSNTLVVKDIQKALNISSEDVKKALISLSVGKYKLIHKEDKGNPTSIGADDKYVVNTRFKNAKRRIKIPNIIFKVTQKEKDDVDDSVKADRRYAIEAGVVRFMKARKTLKHTELVQLVSEQLMQYFRPDPKEIKRRIIDLISREYLERHSEKRGYYNYLA